MFDANAGGADTGAGADNAGSQGAAGAGAADQGAGGQQQQQEAFAWDKAPGVTPDHAQYVTAKGWKDVGSLVDSYRNAEKTLGLPPDQVIRIPKEMDDASLDPIYDKLGRPKDANGYSIKVPEQNGDPEFAKEAATWFHDAGLSQRQAEKITGKWNEKAAALVKAQTDAIAEKHNAEIAEIKQAWGPQEQANLALVDRAAKAFGLDEEGVNALRSAWGPAKALRFLHSVGSKLGVDDSFVNGDGTQTGFGGMTPEQAKAQIAELRKDKGFVQRYSSGDVDARKEMSQLHRIAFPAE